MLIQQQMAKVRPQDRQEISRFDDFGLTTKNMIAMTGNAASIFRTCEGNRPLPRKLSTEYEVSVFNPRKG